MEVTLPIAWVSRVEMDGKNLILLGRLANDGKVTYQFGLTRTGGFGMRADGRVGDHGITHQLLVQHRNTGGENTSGGSREDAIWRTSRTTDPWYQSGKDPWNQSQHGSNVDERGGGTSDKIVVPEFTGEEDREGTKARSYLRKIEAWRRVTRLKADKQALVLYNGLSGKAWRDAEDLDVGQLDHPVTQRYLDKEVVKAGKYMSEFFKHFKRSQNQDIRDFNSEFDRHLSKLREVGCQLPGTCSSWWYVDKLRLDNTTELSLLSSVNNQYDLAQAAGGRGGSRPDEPATLGNFSQDRGQGQPSST